MRRYQPVPTAFWARAATDSVWGTRFLGSGQRVILGVDAKPSRRSQRMDAWRRRAVAVMGALTIGLSGGIAAGCGDDDEGPAEEVGKAVDEAGGEAGEAINEADKEVGEDEK